MELQVSEPSQSENHNIISFSEPKPSSVETQKQKCHRENEDQKKILQLDLSLSSKDSSYDHDHHHHHDDSSKPELNLLKRFDTNSSSENSSESSQGNNKNNNNNNNEILEHRTFSCNYCQRKFYSSQALGGHQNAHKRERTMARRSYKSGSVSLADFGHKFNTMASLPYYNNRTLGIQVHSMIHKPSYQKPFFSFSPNGWKRQHQQHFAMESQPAIGKLFHVGEETESSSSSLSSLACGIPRLGMFPSVSQGFGGYWFGGSSNSGVTNLKSKQEKLQNLDLSLKL